MPIERLTGPLPRPEAAAMAETRALQQAGQQFEAMVIRQMLASATPASAGPEREWRAMADQALADQVARASPLGLADLLARRGTTVAAGKSAP